MPVDSKKSILIFEVQNCTIIIIQKGETATLPPRYLPTRRLSHIVLHQYFAYPFWNHKSSQPIFRFVYNSKVLLQINMIMKNEPLRPLDSLPHIVLEPNRSTSTSDSKAVQHPPPSKLPPGAKVVGNYLLGKNIGQGTFGKVILAMHLPTSEKVAVKLIDKKSMRPKDIIRVKNEIQILKTVRHRNILQLYEIIETEKSVLLITQFLEKGELFRHIIKQKKFSEDQACVYFQQIVAGLEYLHRNRIAHRDLKPENILIDYDNQIKIIDFGLSTQFVWGRDQKSFCGSPCYAAPQIIEGKFGYNPVQSDLWSLGIILFVMLAGYLPFCDQDINSVYKQIVSCNFKIPPHFSAAAKDLVQNLLVKAPNKRMSIANIRDHEWFNRVSPPHAYGVNRGDKLKVDYDLLQRVRQLGVNQNKIIEGLQKNEKNKQTATYFILMKKLTKNYEKIESYIGGNDFNPKFIQVDIHSYDNQTEFSNQITLIQGISGPVPSDIQEGAKGSKGCIGDINLSTQWHVSPVIQDEKYIERSELNDLFKNVFSYLMSFIPLTDQFEQFFAHSSNKQSRIKKIIFQKKQTQFYGNRKLKQARLDLTLAFQNDIFTVTYEDNKRIRTESNNYEVRKRKQHRRQLTLMSSERKQFIFKEREEKRKNSILDNNTEMSVEIKKKPQKVLPYLKSNQFYKLLNLKERSKVKLKYLPPSVKNFK